MKKSKLYGSRLIEDNELTITPELVTLDSIDDVTNLTFDRGNILDASSVKLYLAAISDDLATKYNTLNENFLLAKVAIDGIELSITKNKGIFTSVSSLETTVLSPNVGDWAGVGTAFPVKLYVCNTAGSWADSGSTWEPASLIREENKSIAENVVTIRPNVLNKWGEMSALDITLGFEVSNVLNEYMIEFISGETPTVFNIRGSIRWTDGILVPESNMTYQISIVNGLAVYAGWSNI